MVRVQEVPLSINMGPQSLYLFLFQSFRTKIANGNVGTQGSLNPDYVFVF